MKMRKITDKPRSEKAIYQYTLQWNIFVKWCEDNGYPAMPTNSKVIANFMRDKDKYSGSNLTSYVVAIRYMHAQKSMGIEGCSENYQTVVHERKISGKAPGKHDIKYYENLKNRRFVNDKEIGIDLLESVVSKIPKDITGCRDRAIILLRFFSGLSRIDNISREGLHFDDYSVVINRVYKSFCQPASTMRIPRNRMQHLCPVKALEEWIDAAAITDGPLMRNLRSCSGGMVTAGKKGSRALLNLLVKKHFGEGFSCANMDREEITGEFC
jgi:hypothetical protein